MSVFRLKMAEICHFSEKKILLDLEPSLKISYLGTFWQQTFCKLALVSICCSFRDMTDFWYAEKFVNWTVQVIIIKFSRKLLHINTMNSPPKSG